MGTTQNLRRRRPPNLTIIGMEKGRTPDFFILTYYCMLIRWTSGVPSSFLGNRIYGGDTGEQSGKGGFIGRRGIRSCLRTKVTFRVTHKGCLYQEIDQNLEGLLPLEWRVFPRPVPSVRDNQCTSILDEWTVTTGTQGRYYETSWRLVHNKKGVYCVEAINFRR